MRSANALVVEEMRDVFPLTVVQESLWVDEQRTPGTAAYNVPEAWRLRGTLNADALEHAFSQLVRRHETLRTAFVPHNGCPEQHVFAPKPFRLRRVHLAEASAAALERELAASARRPFPLDQAPLLRADLFRLGEQEHVLLINVHHLVADAWSQRVLMRDLCELYRSAVTDTPALLPELPIQFGDYAAWQRENLTGPAIEQDLAYWTTQLKGPLPLISLPPDHERPAVQRRRGATHFYRLSPELTQALKQLGRQHGSTLFVTLLSAFKVLLSRYTRQQDIIVGAPLAGRDLPETEELVGMFVNTHALRTRFSGDPTFPELLGRVRQTVLEAAAHQQVSIEEIVKALQPERSANRHPLFQVVFGLQGASPPEWELPGAVATRQELDNGATKFDWTLLASEENGALCLRSEYDQALFEAETVSRAVSHFQTLLESIVRSPEARISQLSMLPEAEREKVVIEWNRTERPYERELCVHQVFEARAAEHPERIALVLDGRQMSYGELNARANELARQLRQGGITAGTPVGVCLERSFELIVAMLGILKAGGGYVPLDRGYPAERISFLLRDSGVAVLVTDKAFAPTAADQGVSSLVILDAAGPAPASAANEPNQAGPETLAYIIYTSGSTGNPKGARIPHRAITRLVRNTNYAQFAPDDVFLHLSSVSFDASTLEVWGALLNGARLVLFPPHLPSLAELGRAVQDNQVSVLWLTAGLFNRMVEDQLAALSGVRLLLAGGEALSVPHVRKALEGLPATTLVNGYGPTENTTFTCCYEIAKTWPGGVSVPIGRPIANTRVYILDEQRAPVPIGVPGELYTGGDGLALGYRNRPELTGEKFVADPFCPGGRLYRTGDLARWSSEGTIEFLGRLDEQVKIRGFRVEPGEIETVLQQHPAVRQTVVAARPDPAGTKALVAFVLPHAGTQVAVEELRAFLEQTLPSYLVPAHFVTLTNLPLTENGKVDRAALARLPIAPDSEGEEHAPPRNQLEERMIEIWTDVLGRNSFGVHENFFHLGGHSLLATQVVSRISHEWKVDLSVSSIFEAPTVARLAASLQNAKGLVSPPEIRRRLRPKEAAALLQRLGELTETELDELLRNPDLQHIAS